MNIQHCIDRLIEERDTYAKPEHKLLYDQDVKVLQSFLDELNMLEQRKVAVMAEAQKYWDGIC